MKISLDMCFETLLDIASCDRPRVIKTWLNGWATSHRIKGDFLHNCMLGCELDPDSLSHYLMCPRIYAATRFLNPETSADPLVRCGLCNPTVHSLQFVACTFSAYHALKHRFNALFEASGYCNMDFYANWVFFAQSLSAEAGERRLSSTLFDPSAFGEFLSQTT